MRAARQPADALVPIKDFLLDRIESAESGTVVALSLPPKWQPGQPPAVVLFDDSGTMDWPVSTSPQVRVTVWADGRTQARTIAGKCLGWLLTSPVPGVTHISPGSALLDELDPVNGGRMATFTVNARIRTLPL